MTAYVVALVAAIATTGDGGASPESLLVQHLLVAIAVVAALLGRRSGATPEGGPAKMWLAFAALAALGACVAPYAYAAWLVIVEILSFGAVAWLAASNPASMRRVLPPVVAIVASAHGVAAVIQRVSGAARPASTFLNPNHLAAWLGAAALLLAGPIAERGARRGARLAFCAAAGIALAGMFVTGSRGAVLGLAAGGTVLSALRWAGSSRRARRLTLGTSMAIVLVAATGVAVRFRGDSDPYTFHRARIWAAALRVPARSPWLGTGAGQFAAASPNLNFPLEGTPLRFERAFRTPHSDALRAICEFGLPAGLCALASAGLLARSFWRRRAGASGIEQGAFAALAALAAQGMVDDLSTRPAIAITAAALAGIVVSRPRVANAPNGRIVAVATALFVVLALGAGEVAGFVAWKAARNMPSGRLDPEALARLRTAISWNPMQPDFWRRLAEHHAGDGRTWSIADYAAAREASERAYRLQPSDSFFARTAARVEANACLTFFPFEGTRERAARLFEEAGALARTDATIPLEESRFLLQAGDPAGARRAAERALRIEPRSATPRLVLAEAILREGGPPAADRARQLVDEAEALALRPGATATSPYDASLRSVDPKLLAGVRRSLETGAGP